MRFEVMTVDVRESGLHEWAGTYGDSAGDLEQALDRVKEGLGRLEIEAGDAELEQIVSRVESMRGAGKGSIHEVAKNENGAVLVRLASGTPVPR